MNKPQLDKHARRATRRRRKAGMVIVWCSLLMVVLIGMVGLIVDGGLLMASRRHAQNGADAAALAAAFAKLKGASNGDAATAATPFVTSAAHNNLPSASVAINIPPSEGPYAGTGNYAEAIVNAPAATYFIQVLPGIGAGGTVRAHAVAGYELVRLGKGVMALDPNAKPGLKISGQATLVVDGDVYVNSEGGGVDENGDPVIIGTNQTATTVNNNGSLIAANLNVVGGVNSNGVDNIENIVSGEPNPLHANQLPAPDPLLFLPTPTVANGVVDKFQGEPQATSGGLSLNGPVDTDNYIRNDGTPEAPINVMVLHPGIYTSIKITGGQVEFVPGIYVLKPANDTTFTLEVTGGTVQAEGIMFYNTGSNYDAATGAPDNADYLSTAPPPPPDGAKFGNVKINDSIHMLPLNTDDYSYGSAPSAIEAFNGMLFYQRRQSNARTQIEGDSADGYLAGTFYAKWGELKIDGQGTYAGSFVVGSMSAEGQATMTIDPDGDELPMVPRIFLVE